MGAFGRSYLQDRTSTPIPKEIIGATENLRLSLLSDQPRIVEFLGSPWVIVSLHVGTSLAVDRRRGRQRHRGTTIHGDLEICLFSGDDFIRGTKSTLQRERILI